ncbi:DUF7507 domain-containing protein [Sphingobacterium sp. SYP-B4668]|uniref:DUF7507 domain-containing protein n=1 Tax=Sphingobacterium sp. SYP-B4668 TaxID=2996035 RepID=UPI0022DE5C2E|nr:CARDB domain-containing protein [Sphingobacterium sp. SYP-B4668]
MELFKKPTLINRDFWLKMLCLSLILLCSFSWTYADGSKDLYPLGVQGHRAMLSSSNAAPSNSFPYPNLGIHYVYVQAGEIITLASNAQDPSGTKRIYLYSPSGADVTPAIGAAGNIPNRAAELAGPAKPATAAVGNQYVPLYYTAPTTGIYQVSFLGGNSQGSQAGLANGNWTTGTSTGNVSAWDVSVFKPDEDKFVSGRVWTNVFNFTANATNYRVYAKVYVLTKDGYIYRTDQNGMNGQLYTFFVNNNGVTNSNTKQSIYKSVNASTPTSIEALGLGYSIHNPNLADTETDITYKMFYAPPALDMPSVASGAVPGGSTWLKNTPILPEVQGLHIKGVDGTLGQVSNKGGYIGFTADAQGQFIVEIKSDVTPAAFVTREIRGVASIGNNEVLWDGKGGDGIPLPQGNVPATITVRMQGGEVHFPYFDVENNLDGVIIQRLDNNNLNNVLSDTVYWDDSDITATTGASNPKNNSHLSPTNSIGIRSSVNGHKFSNDFGNNRSLDTWTFIKGEAKTIATNIIVNESDLEVASIVADNFPSTMVSVGDEWQYTSVMRNNGPSAVQTNTDPLNGPITRGATFRFYVPAGVAISTNPADITFSSACAVLVGTPTFANGVFEAIVDMPSGCQATISVKASVVSSLGTYNGKIYTWATILRPNDYTDINATNPDITIPPTDPFFEANGINQDYTTVATGDPTQVDLTQTNNIKLNGELSMVADLAITKEVSAGPWHVRAPVTFTLTAVNNGPSDATGVKVTDLLPSGYLFISATPSTGAYDATTGVWTIGNLSSVNGSNIATLSIVAEIQQSGDYTNVATIASDVFDNDTNNNQDEAGVVTPSPAAADLAIEKVVNNNRPIVGDEVTFTMTVTNNGPSRATNVNVTDIVPNGYTVTNVAVDEGSWNAPNWTIPSLASGGSYTMTITANVLASGTYNNTATVVANEYDPDKTNNTDEVLVELAAPSYTLIKGAKLTTDNGTLGKADVNDVITYTFTVKNTGNVTLKDVRVSDPLANLSAISPASAASLAPGASATFTATYTVVQTDVDRGSVENVATVNGKGPDGTTTVPPVESTPEDPANPGSGDPDPGKTPGDPTVVEADDTASYTLVKGAELTTDNGTVGKADVNDVITYTFTVKNTGKVTLKNVTVSDPLANLSTISPASAASLAPGASATFTATYTVVQTDVDRGSVENVATVNGKGPDGTTTVPPVESTPEDPANPGSGDPDPGKTPGDPTVVEADDTASYTLVKGAKLTTDNGTVGKADVNDVITYTFTVKNTGKVTLKNVTVSDPLANLSTISPASAASLAPGASATFTATYTVVQTDVDRGSVENVATVNGKGPDGTTTVPPVESTPEDPNNPGSGDPDPGKTPGDPTVVEADDTASYTLVKGAKLTTDNGTVGKADVNDVITYTFTVKNTGKVTLKNVTVSDPLANLSTISPASAASLAPGASATFTATYTVVQTDVDRGSVENVATVNGKGPDGTTTVPPVESTPEDPANPGSGDPDPGKTPGDPTVVEADDTASYTLVKGAKLTTDNGTVGKADVNDVITYTFTVKNTGKVTLKNVTVSDPLANLSAISPASAASLAPGASATFTATYTVVQTDVDRGSVENVATVNGKGPDGTTTVPPVESTPEDPANPGSGDPDPGKTPGDPTVVEADDTASYTLVKGAELTTDNGTVGKADVNDVITYTFTVKNTGKVTLKNVTVSDPLANLSAISPASAASLAPGASATFTATYTVVQTDVDRGSVENVATVNGKGPDGTTTVPPVESTPEDPANPGSGDPDPGKTPGDPTVVEADDTASYTLIKGAKLTTDNGTVGKADVNDVITYTFTVKNTGNVTLKDVRVSDPLANLSAISPASAASLAPGASATFTATYTVVQTDVDRGSVENVATVNGKGPDGTTTVPPVESTPEDPANPGSGDPDPGKTPGDPTVVEADDTASYTLVKGAKLTTDNGTVGKADVNDVITYTFTVKNTGKVTLKNVTVSDPLANLSAISPASAASLAPGASATFTATYTVVQTDVDRGSVENVATVNGKGPDGTTTVPPVESTPEDPANPGSGDPDPGKTPGDPTVVEADDTASYTLVKGAELTTDNGTVGKADVNDVITYTFTVKNTGKVTLKNVTVSDPLANLSAISPASAASLAPGASATFTATYTVVQTDVDRGSVENVATVNGKALTVQQLFLRWNLPLKILTIRAAAIQIRARHLAILRLLKQMIQHLTP